MPLTYDDSALYTRLDAFLKAQIAGLEDGLADAARVAEEIMQTSPAHGDQSGATHASYRAFVIGGQHDGSAEAASGYAAAEAKLTGFTGHAGRALRQDSGIRLSESERGILYTSYTDYQDKLEQSDKAVLGPTLQQTAQLATQLAAEGAKANV